jgi:hypothetical protein
MNLDPLAVRQSPQLPASFLLPVKRIAVGTLAVDFNSVIAVFPGGSDEFGEGQGFSAVPRAQEGNAVKPDSHFGFPFIPAITLKAERFRPHDSRGQGCGCTHEMSAIHVWFPVVWARFIQNVHIHEIIVNPKFKFGRFKSGITLH